MEVIFRIQYGTNWGEDVCILFSDGQFLPLHTQDGKKWSGTLTLAPTPTPAVDCQFPVGLGQSGATDLYPCHNGKLPEWQFLSFRCVPNRAGVWEISGI